ncbi:hypothetical protein ES677_13685 [Bizionia gelidisalsuginis]|uniref:Uncharacterized protein n=1 Tax=Bizionia gelidisalsuginis TaxID=291188 RepID=A0ABY3M7I1_9FLAO|nr:hypothetical protein [Bizionia gelidisalsuginis]TYC09150.1 hypothetical protein ES677_13685 [Bizionia gelidisalsuginis]
MRALEPGVEYTVSIYINLAENSDFVIKDIGFLMSAEQLKVAVFTGLSKKLLKKMGVADYSIHNFDSSAYYDNKTDWVRLEKIFMPRVMRRLLLLEILKRIQKRINAS